MKAKKLAFALAVSLGGGLWASLPITALAAGIVDTVSGDTSVASAGGKLRAVAKGDRIVAGDTITTGANGAVLLTTDDSGVLAVRPSSRLTIDAYKANGNDQDSVVLNLLRGTLRSITGWISKTAPKNYRVMTATATIGIRGTDHEVVVGEGAEGAANDDNAGTWNQVTEGATTLATPAGELVQQAGTPSAIGRVSAAGLAPIQALAPAALFRPQATDVRTTELKKDAQSNQQQRLDTRKALVVSSGGASGQGGVQVSTQCAPNAPAQQRLDELIRAYEQGDIAFLQQRLSPAMVGYGAVINDVQTSNVTQRQTRIQIKDRQMQCGPDVASITFNWEKTFLDAVTFRPVIVRGNSSVLLSGLAGNQWQVGGMAGSSPFAAVTGNAGTNGVVSVSAPSVIYGGNNPGCTQAPLSYSIVATLPPSTLGPSYNIQPFITPANTCAVTPSTGGGNACQLIVSGLPGGQQTIQGLLTPPNPAQTTCFVSYTASPPNGLVVNNSGSISQLNPQSSPVTLSGTPGTNVALNAPLAFSQVRSVPVFSIVSANIQVQTPPGTCSALNFQLPANTAPPTCVATPSSLNVAIQVNDADVDATAIQVLVTASNGDSENFALTRISPGVFRLANLPIARGGSAVFVSNGRIDLPYLQNAEVAVNLTITYIDARAASGSNVTRQTTLTLVP